jgi:RNA ligase
MNNKETYDKLVEEGWLISQVHPTLDLTIYNYSQKTQYEKHWTPETLAARGLVINSEGQIVARPFPKFFNASEVEDKIPNEPFEVFEKMDGSLGIFFWYSNEDGLHPVFASRGSFTSDQAAKGWELLQKLPYSDLAYGHTHMFEIIYPENRIVVDYGSKERLVLLGVIQTKSGRDIDRNDLEDYLSNYFELVKGYPIKDSWDHLRLQDEPNREGYVIRFKSGMRVKVKFEEYVRLHRIITNVSNIDIWETLKDGKSLDEILEKVPDEFFNWVRLTERNLRYHHYQISEYAGKIHDYFRYGKYGDHVFLDSRKTKKDFALHLEFCKIDSRIRGICFAMWDKKKYNEQIWRLVKPKYAKPFNTKTHESNTGI